MSLTAVRGHVCEAGNTFQPAATSAPIDPLCYFSSSGSLPLLDGQITIKPLY